MPPTIMHTESLHGSRLRACWRSTTVGCCQKDHDSSKACRNPFGDGSRRMARARWSVLLVVAGLAVAVGVSDARHLLGKSTHTCACFARF